MHIRFTRRSVLASIAAMALTLAGVLHAQDYPNRPIKLIVPYAPGGVTDGTARVVGPALAQELGQPVVIENRPGGASMPGTELVVKARPDGYTLLLGGTALAVNPILFRKIPYDAVKDLQPIGFLATVPMLLVVNPDVPAKSVQELIALAKAKPGALNYGSAGSGSGNHITAEVFKSATGIDVVHIPYKGGGAVMADLIGGQGISFVFAVLPTALSYVKSGKLRALAVTSRERNPTLPDVPTMAEAGLPNVNVTDWLGIYAPVGLPTNIAERLNAAVNKALQNPKVVESFAAQGVDRAGGPPGNLDAYLKSELARWTTLAREAKFEMAD